MVEKFFLANGGEVEIIPLAIPVGQHEACCPAETGGTLLHSACLCGAVEYRYEIRPLWGYVQVPQGDIEIVGIVSSAHSTSSMIRCYTSCFLAVLQWDGERAYRVVDRRELDTHTFEYPVRR